MAKPPRRRDRALRGTSRQGRPTPAESLMRSMSPRVHRKAEAPEGQSRQRQPTSTGSDVRIFCIGGLESVCKYVRLAFTSHRGAPDPGVLLRPWRPRQLPVDIRPGGSACRHERFAPGSSANRAGLSSDAGEPARSRRSRPRRNDPARLRAARGSAAMVPPGA